jgi:hypothetical protein
MTIGFQETQGCFQLLLGNLASPPVLVSELIDQTSDFRELEFRKDATPFSTDGC